VSHSELFARLRRSLRLALYCEEQRITTAEGLARRAEAEHAAFGRRSVLAGLGLLGASAACGSALGERQDPRERSSSKVVSGVSTLDVGIVGGGLAGLACANELLLNGGVSATIYEGNTRTGGRQYSDRSTFAGQTCELGGELIDTSQKNMINYARAFGLTLEDYNKSPGDIFYYIDGALVPESSVVNSLRAFVSAIQADLHNVSAAPNADLHNDADVAVDNTSIADYLVSRGADDLLTKVVSAAYVGEYGREVWDQSSLNFILYIRANRRSNFQPFGTSDQRYHIVEGNDGVAAGLRAQLASSQLLLQQSLKLVRRNSAGRIELTFRNGSVRTHDIVVLAMPFSVMRGSDQGSLVTLDSSLNLPAWKTQAIANLGYGSNAKNMVGFAGRPWAAAGNMGMTYANLPNIQNCWETDWTRATANSAVMTNFTGGALGLAQDPKKRAAQTAAFLGDFDKVFPGAAALANGANVMMAWPKNIWSLASYTCYRPGQFTTIGGNEGKPVGNLYFAGEQCDSFYDQQGFMEGAINSGTATADAILMAAKKAA
jgi:monoamine oxidase